ncbi:terpenoid synthase [Punctularia strigosozonata HHB-11173 SS5]|uniref:terpenoid synthase n=1 Tax=Punctularia strigosozonata (strain HHB-11173) TaxID=741275 RepID=UPI0004416971|nr:terpenoid synthase [Punctularia strigosozonata HHB-11173 SS5]EIN08519.1 terpenoid synthase [Punctularia strigosozonata HHB-11173 SS5]
MANICAGQISKIVLPDLRLCCPFPIRMSPHVDEVSQASDQWIIGGGNITGALADSIRGVKSGLLAAAAYPDAGPQELRLCADFISWLRQFYMDDWTDRMDQNEARDLSRIVMHIMTHPEEPVSGTGYAQLTQDFWLRLSEAAEAGTRKRFIDAVCRFFSAVTQQSKDREAGSIPDLETYILQRRDTGATVTCFALAEYTNHLVLPDEVLEHPILQNLRDSSTDFVDWSNDLLSYNVEQSQGETHNMVCVAMTEGNLDLQSAVNFVGDMCKSAVVRFMKNKALVPSWTPEIDAQVVLYVQCLTDWMSGSLHWSYESERYLGKQGKQVKETGIVDLLPREG